LVHVRTSEKNGTNKEWTCKYIIDASGQDTFLARRLQNKNAYKELDRVAFLNHWKGTKYLQGIDVGLLQIVYLPQHKGGWFGVQPVGKDRLSVGLVVNRKYLKEEKEKLIKSGVANWQEAFYRQEVKACPLTAEITEDAETIQKMIIVSDYSYYAEQTIGDNFVMLGDAGKFLDPIFASGVYLGMNSAKMFAEAIHTKWSEGETKGNEALKTAKTRIDGAYNLVEKFINIFYDPDSFNLAEVSSTSDSTFKNYERAFLLVHFLLAGDFFNKYETYSNFLDMLKSPKQFARWKSLVVNRTNHDELSCGASPEEIFGEIIQELVDESMANVMAKE
ncbi:MAG: NAD(P)/FAD-dependent oxidoreductase, partial [Bacteroidia bacterium]